MRCRQGNLYKVPDIKNVRGFQNLMGITLAEMPNSGDMEPKEPTFCSQAEAPVEG